ncbi:hypothetical protein ACFQ9X_07160 [Catenulispora yoronensis]
MSNGSITTEVRENHGNIHTGPGSQYIFQIMRDISGLGDDRTAAPRRRWVEEQFAWLRARLADPPGSEKIRETLAKKHIVLLRGAPGTGRRTAAMML